MNSTLSSKSVDLPQAEAIVRTVLAAAAVEWSRPDLSNPAADVDLFSEIDSFSVVELLLQTEAEVERVSGRYVPLAGDDVLDAEKSPLRSVSNWISHVAEAIANG